MRVLPILVIIIFLAAAVSAHLGVADSKSGVIHIAEVALGANGSVQCNMPGDGVSFRVSEGANSVQFVIHYLFANTKSSDQRFAVGYKVWKQSGNSWILVADNERAAERAVQGGKSTFGECNIPRVSLASAGDIFRVTVIYDIAGVKSNSTSRLFRVDRSL